MQEDYADLGLQVLGITDASFASAQAFMEDEGLNFPILAQAPATREAFGVAMIWGSTYYLIDAEGRVICKGLDSAQEYLDEVEVED